MNEALFPSYFFARFVLSEMLSRVRTAHGVSCVLHFGDRYSIIEDGIIEQLQQQTSTTGINNIEPAMVPGDYVQIVSGALAGLEAVITEVLPAKERVKLLLDFLGRETIVELNSQDLLPRADPALAAFRFLSRLAVSPITGAQPATRSL